jgi:hypothetical protein
MGDIENNSENTEVHLPYFLFFKKKIFIAMCTPREGLENTFNLEKQRAKKKARRGRACSKIKLN